MQPPHVLFMVNSLATGGAERHLVELIRSGTARGRFTADVVCLKRPGELASELADAPVSLESGWLKHRYDVTAVVRLLALLARSRPDVVYTHSGVNEMCLAQLASTLTGAARVCAVHTTWNTAAGTHFTRAQRLLMRTATRVVGLAASHRRYLIEQERLNPGRTTFITNGVDLWRFRPDRASRATAPRRRIGVVASLLPEKGHADLLEAFPAILAAEPRASLAFAGSGPHDAMLRTTAQRLGIADRVEFLGRVDRVDQLLPTFDIFVLPSRRETFSMAVLEAMASSVPVVVTHVGSMPDMIVDGRDGFIVEPGDRVALADRIKRLLSDTDLAHRLGAAARKTVEREFTLDRMVDRYCELFENL